VAEGWTQYYGIVTLARAGVVPRPIVHDMIANTLQYEAEVPSRQFVSARTGSLLAPFWDGGAQPMATNRAWTWINYYPKGAALAMLLDLELRTRSNGARSLDDVLRELKRRSWDQPNASYYLQGRGYTEDDVVQAASTVAGESMQAWFDRYVGGTDPLPWSDVLPRVGMRLVIDRPATGQPTYHLEEIPDATPAQRALREGWLGTR
jgi:predicted metalloprotease with PDZ domain